MKKRLISVRWLAAVMACLMMTMVFSPSLAAKTRKNDTGTITVTIGDEDSPFNKEGNGIQISLYRIGSMDSDFKWYVNSNFAGIDILGATTSAEIDAVADQVATILHEGHASATVSSRTNAKGTIVFKNLKLGIYFGEMAEGPSGLKMQNFLINVPYFKDQQYVYSVTVKPKYVYTEEATESPSETPTETPSETPTESPSPPPSPSPSPTPTLEPGATPTLPTYEELMNEPTPTPHVTDTPVPEHPYTVTVYYIYSDGTTAWPTYYEPDLWPGTDYDVVSPVIPGYVATIVRVTGTMPHHDVEYTVVYIPITEGSRLINLDDYETPLGLGDIQMHVGVCYE